MIFPHNVMSEHEVKIEADAKLVLYTDGLIEVRNPDGEVFGFRRFTDAVLKHGRERGVREMGERLLDDIQAFAAGAPFLDDYTLVIAENRDA